MKKTICLLLVLSILFAVPIDVSAEGTSYDTGIVDLPQKSNDPTEVRTRKKVDGLRMYVDEENPLFMSRAEWNEETKALTLTVISNGEVRITIE